MARMGLRSVTAAELPHIPAEWRNELVRGEVRPMTPPGLRHGVIATRLARAIGSYVDEHALGLYLGSEVGFWIERGPDTVRGPDGAFLVKARLGAIDLEKAYVDGPPDLAVEIVSPNDRVKAVHDKARMWIDTGAAMAVVLDPKRRTTVVFTRDGARGARAWHAGVRQRHSRTDHPVDAAVRPDALTKLARRRAAATRTAWEPCAAPC